MRIVSIGLFVLGLAVLPGAGRPAAAADPDWALSVKGGYVKPAIDDWDSVYPTNMVVAGVGISRRLGLGFDLEAGISHGSASGKAITLTGRASNDSVTSRFVPVELTLVYRLELIEDQIVVPYAGAGLTYTAYQVELRDDKRNGDQGGYHLRAGALLLLDRLDPWASKRMARAWGLRHTYLYLEYYASVVDDFGAADTDLGSAGIAGGLRFAF